MVRTISTPEAKETFEDLVGSVEDTKEAVVLERDGRPVAVVISLAEYDRLLREEEERDWAVIDRLRERNADKNPDEVYADVTAEIEAMRRERREARQRSA